MGRLSTLKPRIGSMSSRLGYASGDEKARDRKRATEQPWRKWYNVAEWKTLRMRVFIRDHFTCQICGRIDGNTSRLIGDHKVPHRGDRSLFFDEENVWTLCKPCHDSEKQKRERAEGRGRVKV